MIIDGKQIAHEIQSEIKNFTDSLKFRKPCLAVVLVGNHPASKIYVSNKIKACSSIGIESVKFEFPETLAETELLALIENLNQNQNVDGILVQLPLPQHINPLLVTQKITPEKDVDGFHPLNIGKMATGEGGGFIPCTPLGIKTIMQRMKIETEGKQVLILGRSNIVGKPMALLLMDRSGSFNATVTVANRHTPNIEELCQKADIIIAAMGSPLFVKSHMVKDGAVVIDVGMNKITIDGKHKFVGDVDFEHIKEKCSFITPVPGGVGPMTIAMLLSNTILSYKRRFHLIQEDEG